MTGRSRGQSGQVMVLVAVVLVALIGAAALVLLAGSVEWQRNQLQELADNTALDASLKIEIGCDPGKAAAVIDEARLFLVGRRGPSAGPGVGPGSCAASYVGTYTYGNPLLPMTATITYPYRSNQQQVEIILNLVLPISFGGVEGIKTTNVSRRALAQGLAASVPALSAATVQCQATAPNTQVNVLGSVVSRNLMSSVGNCALYAHARFDAASGTFSDFGNVTVRADGQAPWARIGGRCAGGARLAYCADGYELSGFRNPACGISGTTEYLLALDKTLNPNPCAVGVSRLAGIAPVAGQLPTEPDTDPSAVATLVNTGGAPCAPPGPVYPGAPVYPPIKVGAITIGTGLGPSPALIAGFYHFKPSCYGYLDISLLPVPHKAVFDPGFYFFNGARSGLAGGGVCLNKTGQLVGHDVTMEFVRTATFSTGNCVGGAGSGGAFGSQAAVAGGLTWLSAPCNTPPNAFDAISCRGAASWCPSSPFNRETGDRACWNLLIWAPAAIAGTFQVDSAGATAWLLGSVSWPGTCLWGPRTASAIDGAVSCGTFRFTNATSSLATIGGDFGVNTALAEALLIE